MGLLKNITGIFGKRRTEDLYNEQNMEDEGVCVRRDEINLHDSKQRDTYVRACLEQLAEASRELDVLSGEYNLVTAYLTDMEEIDALPADEKQQLIVLAKKIGSLEENQNKKKSRKRIMSEEDFKHMERIEEYMPEGYDKLKEAEEYQGLIKNDLKRLDGEKQAYYFRRNELEKGQGNLKGIIAICIGSMLFLVVMLAILGSVLHIDVELGYLMAVLVAACALTFVYVRFEQNKKEVVRVEKTLNKLILLQNTVKIRYVNNTNLLEYLYMKYDIESSAKLKKLWEQYLEEKKQREEEAQLRKDMDFTQVALIRQLRMCKVQDPNIWIKQSRALYDNKEMVEIRHGLIIRRQKLRKQMEYNGKMAHTAQEEVKDLVARYPQYAKEILDMVSEYEEQYA